MSAGRSPLMRPFERAASVVATVALVAGCATQALSPDDRRLACHVAVEESHGRPIFRPNPLSQPTGGFLGAGLGALAGLQGGITAIITLPLGALVGAVYGTACVAAASTHPTADAHFERVLLESEGHALGRALMAELASVGKCRPTEASGSESPSLLIRIAKVEVGMDCLFGQQEYWIAVEWRSLDPSTGRVLTWTTTRRRQTSHREVDDWFANPDYAKAQIERALTRTGERMAKELLGERSFKGCELQSRADAGVEMR